MLLFQWAIIGRPSCVTTYCPLLEHTVFPKECDNCCPVTGLPILITVNMTNWKSRTKSRINKHYPLILWCNCVRDPRFCPSCWLMRHVISEKSHATRKGKNFVCKGPIFKKPQAEQYCSNVAKLFKATQDKVLIHCTAYSIRRAGAQTVKRCGFDLIDARATMREKDIKNAQRYIAQGPLYWINWQNGNSRESDPMKDLWWYKPNTKATIEDEFL